MGIYDTIMGRGANPNAPGAGAVTDPLDLPSLTPEMFQQMYPGAAVPGGTPGVTTTTEVGTPPPTDRIGGTGPYANKAIPVEGQGKAGKIIAAAQSLIGTPYVWGGASTTGVDCSGLVQLAYKAAGISMPRVSYQQGGMGQKVGLNEMRPGDLVLWDNSSRNAGADHVAIYIGGGRIIEAARPGTNVRISKLYDTSRAWGVRVLGGK